MKKGLRNLLTALDKLSAHVKDFDGVDHGVSVD